MLPAAYPLTEDVDFYLSDELSFGRLLDFGVILPRLQQLYEWSASELMIPDLLGCVTDGVMTYAWSLEEASALRDADLVRDPDGPAPDAPGRNRTCIPRLGGACSIH